MNVETLFIIITVIYVFTLWSMIQFSGKEKKECVRIGMSCGIYYGVRGVIAHAKENEERKVLELDLNEALAPLIEKAAHLAKEKLEQLNNIKNNAPQSEFSKLIEG